MEIQRNSWQLVEKSLNKADNGDTFHEFRWDPRQILSKMTQQCTISMLLDHPGGEIYHISIHIPIAFPHIVHSFDLVHNW
jgi:hypothetical protein